MLLAPLELGYDLLIALRGIPVTDREINLAWEPCRGVKSH